MKQTSSISYERVSKEDGAVSPANEHQVRRGLESAVKDVDFALHQIEEGAEIANNFWIYRLARPTPENIKHPYSDYDLNQALHLARSLIYGPLPKESDPIPSVPDALKTVKDALSTCGFNWITGQTALQLLRAASGEPNAFER